MKYQVWFQNMVERKEGKNVILYHITHWNKTKDSGMDIYQLNEDHRWELL